MKITSGFSPVKGNVDNVKHTRSVEHAPRLSILLLFWLNKGLTLSFLSQFPEMVA